MRGRRSSSSRMIFAIAMDYTVFLLAAAKEHWEKSGDPKTAMVEALAHSGRVIFAAGGVMVAVFFTFALSVSAATQGDGSHPRNRRPARRLPGPARAAPRHPQAHRAGSLGYPQVAATTPPERPLLPLISGARASRDQREARASHVVGGLCCR